MRHRIYFTLALATIFAAVPSVASATNTGMVTLKRAQVTGIEDTVISIAYSHRGRQVYDPLVITPTTAIYVKSKPAKSSAIRLRQYLALIAIRQGDELIAQRIDIGTPPKIVAKPKPKLTVKNAASLKK